MLAQRQNRYRQGWLTVIHFTARGVLRASTALFLSLLSFPSFAVVTYDGTNGMAATVFNNCTGCHSSALSGTARNGAPDGVNYDSYSWATYSDNEARAVARINDSTYPMPPGGQLSYTLRNRATVWQSGGYLRNAPPNADTFSTIYNISKYSAKVYGQIKENGYSGNLLFRWDDDGYATGTYDASSPAFSSPSGTGGSDSWSSLSSYTMSNLACGQLYGVVAWARYWNGSQYVYRHDNDNVQFTTLACPSYTTTSLSAVTEGITSTRYINATDPEGDSLTFSIVGTPPPGMSISNYDANTATITYTAPQATSNYTTNFTVRFNDGTYNYDRAYSISVLADNDAPVISSNGGQAQYVENSAGVTLYPSISIQDIDNSYLDQATVAFTPTSFYDGEQDELVCPATSLSCSFNKSTGVLTLSGVAPISTYVSALSNVQYRNTENNPATNNRAVRVQVRDSGGVLSNYRGRPIVVVAVNDPPQISSFTNVLSYTEGDGRVLLDSNVSLFDYESDTISGATLVFVQGYQRDWDELDCSPGYGISCDWNNATGQLKLVGTASLSDYQNKLRGVGFSNTSDMPTASNRIIRLTVTDSGGGSNTDTADKTVTVTAVNDPPEISGFNGSLSYTEDSAPVSVASGVLLQDPDGNQIVSAAMALTPANLTGDVLACAPAYGISCMYTATTGVLALQGSATVSQYQTVLQSITYVNNSQAPSETSRNLQLSVTDSAAAFNTGSASRALNVTAVDDAPTASNNSIYVNEDQQYVLGASTFGFNDVDGHAFSALVIETLPLKGDLYDNGVKISSLPYSVPAGSLSGLTYQPDSNENGLTYASFRFEVEDSGASNNRSNGDYIITINVNPVSDAPVSANSSINAVEDTVYQFSATDFSFSDVDGDSFAGVRIESLPANGILRNNGSPISVTPFEVSNITQLSYQADANSNGANLTAFQFEVIDSGASTNVSQGNYQMTVNVAAVNDPAQVAQNNGATAPELGSVTLGSGNLASTDIDDADSALQYTVVSTPAYGELKRVSSVLGAGASFTQADINSGLISYTQTDNSGRPVTDGFVFSVVDDEGLGVSGQNFVISITLNSAPVISAGGVLNYLEDDPATPVSGVSLSDADNDLITGAIVQISSNYQINEDSLGFSDQNGITGTFTDATGTMTLTGNASLAAYQAALASVTYFNDSQNPAELTRTVTYQVTDDFGLQSAPATAAVNVARVNDAPTQVANTGLTILTGDTQVISANELQYTDIEDGAASIGYTLVNAPAGALLLNNVALSVSDSFTQDDINNNRISFTAGAPGSDSFTVNVRDSGNAGPDGVVFAVTVSANAPPVVTAGATLNYSENAPATVIDSGISITDAESNDIQSAMVQISAEYAGAQDVLVCPTAIAPISCTPGAGSLAFSGTASIAAYQNALRAVSYRNSSDSPSTQTRTVSYTVTDSANGVSGSANAFINVSAVNDAPTTADNTITINEDEPRALLSTDFPFNDVDGDSLQSVTIVSLPANGALQLNGAAVSTGQAVTLAQLGAGQLVFTPASNDSGSPYASFAFNVSDGVASAAASATLTINVAAVNDAPVITANAGLTVKQNNQITLSTAMLSAADVDDAASSILFTVTTPPASGSLSASSFTQQDLLNGAVSYTAAGAGSDSFTFNVQDAAGAGPQAQTFMITVNPNQPPVVTAGGVLDYTENDAPTAINGVASITDVDDAQMQSATVQITGNFVSTEDVLTCPVSLASGLACDDSTPGLVSITSASTNSIADYLAAMNAVRYENTSDNPDTTARVVSYSIVDDEGNNSSTAAAGINVIAVNDAPVAANGNIGLQEDEVKAILASDFSYSDPDADTLQAVRIDSLPLKGMLAVTGVAVTAGQVVPVAELSGNLTYTPAANEYGDPDPYASFDFSVYDGAVYSSASYSMNLNVAAVNDLPQLTANAPLSVTELGSATITTGNLAATDLEDDAGNITYTVTSAPVAGSLNLSSFSQAQIDAGQVSYTHTSAGQVSDSFTFNISDSEGGEVTGAVFTINISQNAAPVVTTTGNLAFTEDDAASVVSAISIADADNDDIQSASVAISNNFQSTEDSLLCPATLPGGITCNDSVAGTLTFSNTSTAANYAAALSAVRYMNTSQDPNLGLRTVSYQVTDTFGNTSAANATVAITRLNDAPTAADSVVTLPEDTPGIIQATAFNFTDVDSADNLASITIVSLPDKGQLLFNDAPVTAGQIIASAGLQGGLTFEAEQNAFGTPYTSFAFRVSDGQLDSVASYTMTINVTAVDDAPFSSNGVMTAVEDAASPVPLSAFSFDDRGDGDSLQAVQISALPGKGSLLLAGATVSANDVIPVAAIAAGNLTYTALADEYGAAYTSFSFRVSDGNLISQTSYTMTIDVAAQNDAPRITSMAAPDALETRAYSFNVMVSDPEQGSNAAEFDWTISSQPAGMTVSNAGVVSWTPPQEYVSNTGATAQFTLTVTDDGGLTDTRQFVINVAVPDSDNDGLADYADNCPADANADQADLDGDNIGDVCDSDRDGDGMDNSFEDAYAFLDADDPTDASGDQDNDGLSNLEEFLQGKDPTVDDAGPVITLPPDIVANATGYFTDVELGVATAYDLNDGVALAVANPLPPYLAGRNRVQWTAVDAQGNTTVATQIVDILPMINLQPDQVIGEGNRARIRVLLSGEASVYPVVVRYSIAGTATVDDYSNFASNVQPADASVSGGEIIINSGTEVSFEVDILQDNIAESDESLLLTLSDPQNAVLGVRSRHQITLTENNIAPQVTLQAVQANGGSLYLHQGDGLVTISAQASDANGDALVYNWSADDELLLLAGNPGASDSEISFDPFGLAVDRAYTVEVEVTDNASPPLTTRSSISFYLIAGSSPTLVATDSDGDGVNDDAEGLADSDADGIPDYLDSNNVPELAPNQTAIASEALYLQVDAGLMIRPGPIAIAAGRQGLQIQHDDYAAYGVSADIEDSYRHVAGDFNFEITGLGSAQATANVVLPIQSALPSNAVYRKFWPEAGWREFVIDENNRVASAPGLPDACPAPGSELYTDGLQPFHFCIQLTIEDGGPNDLDGERNGRIVDPGGPAVPPLPGADNPDETAATDANASSVLYGGAMSLLSLLGLCWLVWLRCCGSRGWHRYNKP